MFIETEVYDSPHQSGSFYKNELINVNSIIKITPVIDVYGQRDECFIHLKGYPNTTYVRSCDSYETLRSKLEAIKLL
jgi:hypothetical protein